MAFVRRSNHGLHQNRACELAIRERTCIEGCKYKLWSRENSWTDWAQWLRKTVLLRIICGLYRAASGTVCVNGQYVGQDVEFPASTGILIESPGFIPYYSGYKNLQVLAELNYRTTDAMVRNAISLVGLSADEKKSVGKYSLGMRQRLGIAQALMENPQLLILDEPMNGLDNKGVSDMRMLFKKLRHEGKTILLASHNPLDIDELCDTVCEMDAGVLKRKL